jgi:hypothetical protein
MPATTRIKLENRFGGSTACKITFLSEEGLYTINQELLGSTWRGPYDEHLIDVTTNKDLSNPCGSFSMNLHDRPIPSGPLKGRRLQDVLRPHDLVIISFRRGPVFRGQMIGLVGAKPLVVEDLDQNGARIRTVNVSGFDFGKFLLTAQSFYFKDMPEADPVVAHLRGQLPFFQEDGPFAAYGGMVPRHKLFSFMLEQWLFKLSGLNWRGGQMGELQFPLRNMLNQTMGATFGEIPFTDHTIDDEMSLYSFMSNVAEKPWCEFFVDTWPIDAEFQSAMVPDPMLLEGRLSPFPDPAINVMPHFVLRETPFDKEKWNQLPVFEIDNEVIHRAETSGEGDVYSIYYARPPAYAGSNTSNHVAGQGIPAFDMVALERYGYRPLMVECRGIPNVREDDGENQFTPMQQQARDFTNRLARWFYMSPEFLSGSFTLQGNPQYNVGTRLRRFLPTFEHGDAWEFYIEGLTNTFATYGQYRTTLRVTRGLRPDQDRFAEPSHLVNISDFNLTPPYWGRH